MAPAPGCAPLAMRRIWPEPSGAASAVFLQQAGVLIKVNGMFMVAQRTENQPPGWREEESFR